MRQRQTNDHRSRNVQSSKPIISIIIKILEYHQKFPSHPKFPTPNLPLCLFPDYTKHINIDAITSTRLPAIFTTFPFPAALFFDVVAAAEELAGNASVDVITAVVPGTTLSDFVVPGTVLGCAVETVVEVTLAVLTACALFETVDDIVDETTNTLETTEPGIVVGEIVVAGIVLPGRVVV